MNVKNKKDVQIITMKKKIKIWSATSAIALLMLFTAGCSSSDEKDTDTDTNTNTTSNEEKPSNNESTNNEQNTSDTSTTKGVEDTSETETTDNFSSNDEITTKKETLDDGSIKVTSTYSDGRVFETIEYKISSNSTIKYVYEYNERSKLTGIYDYEGPGNLIAEFSANDYTNATMSGFNNCDDTSNINIDLGSAFEVTIEELAPLYKKAEEIWDTYGVAILIADKISDYTSEAEACNDYTKIKDSLKLIENALKLYPKNFFRDFSTQSTDVVVCIQLVGPGGPPGVFSDHGNFKLVQIDANNYQPDDDLDNGSFFSYTLHHEICHMISYTLLDRAEISSCPLTEEKWNSFNPAGFEYVGYYDDAKESELITSGNNNSYFLFPYSCSTAEEDRAILFGTAMEYYLGFDNDMFTPYIDAKYEYLCKCIRAGFDSSDWPNKMPWEVILD